MNTGDFKDIVYTREDNGIVTVTLNVPKRKNALSAYTCLELWWAVDAMEKDDRAKVMILTGARDPGCVDPTKEAFCSGGYFNPASIEALSAEDKAQIDFTDIAQKKLTLKMWAFDKPVIAAVNGLAIGGGFTLCLACADLIYMSEHAWASLPFVGLGLIPELASSYLLPRLLGLQRVKEICYFSERITARELLELGLINRIVPHDELIPFCRERALKLIAPRGAEWAVRACKRILHKPYIEAVNAALDRENEALNRALATADFREALAARMEKRPPAFRGQ
jgi:2-(1,2-epoxy-1,2-dihydrophenyl)acetyl-CoA isomerase